jgi:hypothetical protein
LRDLVEKETDSKFAVLDTLIEPKTPAKRQENAGGVSLQDCSMMLATSRFAGNRSALEREYPSLGEVNGGTG